MVFRTNGASEYWDVPMDSTYINFSACTYNCHGLKSNMDYVLKLSQSHDIVFMNEHWLQDKDLNTVRDIFNSHNKWIYLKSSVDPTEQLIGRPYGGLGFACVKAQGRSYQVLECVSDRVLSLQVTQNNEVVLYLVGVYLPTRDHTELYLETLACMQELMESVNSSAPIVILGDMNTVLLRSDYLHEKWYFDKRYTNHSLHDFISKNRMCVADLMFEQRVSSIKLAADSDSLYGNTLIGGSLKNPYNTCSSKAPPTSEA